MTDLLNNNFTEILALIREARNRALSNINKELINLYWQVGQYISKKVASAEWGKSIVSNLAEHIQRTEPDIKGFNVRNLWRMKQFYEIYKDHPKLSPLVTQLSWTNNLIIITACKTEEEREFYLHLAIKEKYSKRELERQIVTGIFERTKIAQTKLSPVMRELPQNISDTFKDTYVFEFLGLPERHSESDLQKSLVQNLKRFILELGGDFTFMGENYRLQVGNEDFYVDLLFYNRLLQCLVAIDLKIDKFRPEHIGQLEFYLEALDRDVKKAYENPSIGILLCAYKDNDIVEYALSRSISPTLIADYETKLIPKSVWQKKLHELLEYAESQDEK